MMWREIVTIDEDLCDGCGQCVPACHEGALKIVDGKARLAADRLCDGLGACIGHCPRGAIRVERRCAEQFDEAAVQAHLQGGGHPVEAVCPPPQTSSQGQDAPTPRAVASHAGCPGSGFLRLAAAPRADDRPASNRPARADAQVSELRHWPVQLRLLSANAPVLQGAKLLVAADCVPVAMPNFHAELLRERAVAIACPKLDDTRACVEKLAEMLRLNDVAEVTVAHMEVPCCTGILHAVMQARELAGSRVTITDVVISVRGEILARRVLPADAASRPVGRGCGAGGCG